MNTQSYLPDELERVGLKDLVVGEIVYIVDWAIYAETDRSMWANANYPFTYKPGGTSRVKVERVAEGLLVHKDTLRDAKYSATGARFLGESVSIPVQLV